MQPLHVPPREEFERLPLWKNAWRLAMAWVLGLILFLIYIAPVVMASETGSAPETDAVLGLILLDLLVGHVILVLAAFRRRAPVAIAVVTMALTTVSAWGVPAAFLVVFSLATRRRLLPLVWLGLLNVAAGLVHEHTVAKVTVPAQFRDSITGQGALLDGLVYAVLVSLFYVVVVLIGWNIGSRRELVASWRQQAETANREQAARVAQAQLAERARIAREMHDVLAHRLSLVAMHAGVLAHRPDLSEEERAEATEVVRAGTHQALEELREVLGVLRTDGDADGGGVVGAVEAPQPGLSGIPSLVAEVTSSGQEVRLLADADLWQRSVSLPTTVGRHAYRVVQEALTNARKHAPEQPVTVQIHGAPGQGLSVEIRNRVVPDRVGTLPESGRGLTGMAERAQLAGGTFRAGVEVTEFVVLVRLPWPVTGEDA
ncbi:sensor histidine kinase [Ornithinimicrobium tianjinense]|uniref:histidine kinase n=1 Tax=Ornithinimicrobium tianjinense TaxID=1195761 RepID=A0A917BC76_9MICO|nr:histidine kinase [Ornithinimicrobium tianjinense]GGF36693.1 two-component sensor histidine kinase [Ornithinimicrobium tianjinense]